MKYLAVLEYIKKKHCCDCIAKPEACSICKYGIAIEALEKQIPRKPIDIEDKMWGCPHCYNNLLNKWVKYPEKLMPKSSGLPYCMSCGQAIDWSEVKE